MADDDTFGDGAGTGELPAFFTSGTAVGGLEDFEIGGVDDDDDEATFGDGGGLDGAGAAGLSEVVGSGDGGEITAGDLLDAAMEAGDDDEEWERSRTKFAMLQKEFLAGGSNAVDNVAQSEMDDLLDEQNLSSVLNLTLSMDDDGGADSAADEPQRVVGVTSIDLAAK